MPFIYSHRKVKKVDKIQYILIVLASLFSLIAFISKHYNVSVLYQISILIALALFSLVSMIYLNKTIKILTKLYNRIWNGQNKMIKFLSKKKFFKTIISLFIINDFLMLGFFILAVFISVSYYKILKNIVSFFISNWYTASIILITSTFGFYLAILLFLTTSKLTLKSSDIMIYLEYLLKNSKNLRDFDDYLGEYLNRINSLSSDYKDHIETYYSLRFVQAYMGNFLFLPSQSLKDKKQLITEFINQTKRKPYSSFIISLMNIDKKIKKKFAEEYSSVKNYLCNIYDSKNEDLFLLLKDINMSKFDKIKKFLLSNNEILVFIIKSVGLILILFIAVKYSDLAELIIQFIK